MSTIHTRLIKDVQDYVCKGTKQVYVLINPNTYNILADSVAVHPDIYARSERTKLITVYGAILVNTWFVEPGKWEIVS